MSTFRFKQFTIHQEKAQMKVGTDSIILGSAIKIKKVNTNAFLMLELVRVFFH